MATRKCGNIYFPQYFVAVRPFLTRIFFQELFGLEGSKKFLEKFRQVHNLKISNRLLRSKSFFRKNMGIGQKRELPVLFGQKRMYPENNSGRDCCWPYLIGQHPLSPVFGQKRPGTPGNSYFAQLPPVFGHFMFRSWPFHVPFRWATRLLE